jgi:hypothetical protein
MMYTVVLSVAPALSEAEGKDLHSPESLRNKHG